MTKATFLTYHNQTDHRFFKDQSLEVLYEKHHPYDINELNIASGSKYLINHIIQIGVYDGGQVSLVLNRWLSTPDLNLKMYINGSHSWSRTDESIITLSENDIIEISWHDATLDALIHHIVVISKISP